MVVKKQKWVMPAWVEPYCDLIINTGGNSVEELMNGNADPFINLPLSTIQACVKSQVGLLNILHDRGLLARPSHRGREELLACPFCGSVPTSSNAMVWCDAGSHPFIKMSRQEWNTRPAEEVDIEGARAALSQFLKFCRTDMSRAAGEALTRLRKALSTTEEPKP